MKHAFSHIDRHIHGKNNFAEVSKNFARIDLKIILLDCQNNYVGRSNWLPECNKTFCSIADHVWDSYIIILVVQQN